MNSELKQKLFLGTLLPVLEIDDPADAAKLGPILLEEGFDAAEITFRTACADDAIRTMKAAAPDLLIAAGTVICPEQITEAIKAGADLIVSPGYNAQVVDTCLKNGISVIPGCMTPSDVEEAANAGLDVVKFFPAEAAGGLSMIRSLAGPFKSMRFVPSGGLSAANAGSYLDSDLIVCASGSWMVDKEALKAKDFGRIRQLCRQAMSQVMDFSLAHIGINASDPEEAAQIAHLFEQLFGFEAKENPSSIFCDTYAEILKSPYLGANGHIAIGTPCVERAKHYLEHKGIRFNEKSAVFSDSGFLQAIYFENEIGGFAVHLVRRAR